MIVIPWQCMYVNNNEIYSVRKPICELPIIFRFLWFITFLFISWSGVNLMFPGYITNKMYSRLVSLSWPVENGHKNLSWYQDHRIIYWWCNGDLTLTSFKVVHSTLKFLNSAHQSFSTWQGNRARASVSVYICHCLMFFVSTVELMKHVLKLLPSSNS